MKADNAWGVGGSGEIRAVLDGSVWTCPPTRACMTGEPVQETVCTAGGGYWDRPSSESAEYAM